MRVPTVKLRRKSDGKVFTVNEMDYAEGKLPGMNVKLDDFERVSEERGEDKKEDQKKADDTAEATANANKALEAKAEEKK
jgi:hypothetical protein